MFTVLVVTTVDEIYTKLFFVIPVVVTSVKQ